MKIIIKKIVDILKSDSPAPVRPSDNCSPNQNLDWNLMKDPEPEPCKASHALTFEFYIFVRW